MICMPIKISMGDALESILVLIVVSVICILGNWKLAEGNNENAGRKLVDHIPGM